MRSSLIALSRSLSFALAAATALLTLAACGSSNGSSPSVASVGGGGQGNNRPSAQAASAGTAAQAGHDLAACFRAHGIPAKDPVLPIDPNQDLAAAFGISGGKSALAHAANACGPQFTAFEHLALPPPPFGSSPAQATKFAHCMRTTGGIANWPDPAPGDNPFSGHALRQLGIDTTSQKVLDAVDRCDVNKH